ncbi:YdeI/OmpD-associated family protein [Paenibacillus xerothermodurans]|uniref:DUF1905 domain-containing protein n=1 Tax=Paenibacillus xerothermodurans TaxID=1977292 RepID=A0A2W1NW06_PAEXE|nr:YdeI/OmpD-associated family protein [Paenibacillus xerothermodurans]PZE19008.1 DUF1905 domain-containing protein [Paenibacillus xerothermodurans]
MKFRAVIHQGGKTATGIYVPEEVVVKLGASKKPPVKITIGDYTYRSTVASMGGQFAIPLSAANRKAANVEGGDEVDVYIELDTEPRELTVPPDFSDALDRVPEARRFFDGLSFSNKSRFVLSIEGAKTAETRQRRIEKAVSTLKESKIQ